MNTFFARLWTEQLDRVPAADGKRLLGSGRWSAIRTLAPETSFGEIRPPCRLVFTDGCSNGRRSDSQLALKPRLLPQCQCGPTVGLSSTPLSNSSLGAGVIPNL